MIQRFMSYISCCEENNKDEGTEEQFKTKYNSQPSKRSSEKQSGLGIRQVKQQLKHDKDSITFLKKQEQKPGKKPIKLIKKSQEKGKIEEKEQEIPELKLIVQSQPAEEKIRP